MQFYRDGDVAGARGDNFVYVKVGDKYKFTFTGKTASRRGLRVIIKDLIKLSGGE